MQEEILSLSTTNRGGGAEKIATTIHEGLLARDWKSRLLVGRKTGEDPSTIAIHASPYFDYRTVASSVPVKFQHAILARDRFLGREAFHYPFTVSV